jgi:multidrug efflux pump subunit AcrA (membrane-fusion protein)
MSTILPLIAAALLFTGCTSIQEAKEKPPEKKIQTYKVNCQEVSSSIQATGTIQPDIEGSAKIISNLAGTVEGIYKSRGQGKQRRFPVCHPEPGCQ